MYLGFVLIVLGVAILLHNQFILPEEKALEAAFGEQWDNYRSKVRRWI